MAHDSIEAHLPRWSNAWQDRLRPALAWQPGRFSGLEEWRREARQRLEELASVPDTADVPLDVQVEEVVDRGTYVRRKVSFADELARRGYAVLAADGFFWGERRVAGAEDRSGGRVPTTVEETRRGNQFLYEQQAMVSMNLMQLGLTWQGILINDDRRAAEVLASLPEVDGRRIACCGLSVGCYRSWTLAALSDRIRACVGICWMATQESLMRQPNNQNRSQSAYSMLIPGMRRWLEIPDVASLVCPRGLLLYAGRQDELFPEHGTEAAFARIRSVYQDHGCPESFVGQWWDRPHCFDRQMQDAAFDWLGRALQQ